MKKEITNFRVVKKLSPDRPGAIKLAQRYGKSLVCVRHRVDTSNQMRITTVELIVDCVPIQRKPDDLVGVQIGAHERSLQSTVRAAGAKWDSQAKVWRMPLKVARALNLRDRITEK